MSNLNLLPRQFSTKDRLKLEMRAAATAVMDWLAEDEHGCNGVVASGKTFWREQCLKHFRDIGVPCDAVIADRIYAFAEHMVRQREYARHSPLTAQQIAATAIDHLEEVAPAVTAEEVIDSLEIDSAGTSDDARRFLYGRDESAETHWQRMKASMKRILKRGGNPFTVKPEDVQ